MGKSQTGRQGSAGRMTGWTSLMGLFLLGPAWLFHEGGSARGATGPLQFPESCLISCTITSHGQTLLCQHANSQPTVKSKCTSWLQQLAPTSKEEMTSRYTTQLGPAQIRQTGGQRQLGAHDLVASGLWCCVWGLCPLVPGPWLEPRFCLLCCPWLASALRCPGALSTQAGPKHPSHAAPRSLRPTGFLAHAHPCVSGWFHSSRLPPGGRSLAGGSRQRTLTVAEP